jgi:hypothetical protein
MTSAIILYTCSSNVVTVSNVADESELWFTVKDFSRKADADSILQISKTDGLLYANGHSPSAVGLSSGDGSITVVGGNANIFISACAAPILFGDLPVTFTGEIKTRSSASIVSVVTQFPVIVKPSLTKAIQ